MNSNGHRHHIPHPTAGTGEDLTVLSTRRAPRTLQSRGGRRLLAPLAGAALTLALLAGCGGETEAGPAEEPVVETTADEDTDSTEETASDETDETDEDSATEQDDEAETDGTDDAGGEDASDDGAGENLFEGSWGFGHDAKTLSAEELAVLLEEKAKERGPSEMSLSVTCADGIDTTSQDYTAECTAVADEGVEHAWTVTGGPADAGLDVEVENDS